MNKSAFYIVCFSILLACFGAVGAGPDHGQGEMAGRVTEKNVILQSRLTQGTHLVDGDLPGCPGVARFEISTNPDFKRSRKTKWMEAVPENDYIVKTKVTRLKPATRYYYRLHYGASRKAVSQGRRCTFKTLGGKKTVQETRFAVVTGMNYFFFQEGPYDPEKAYKGPDKHLGFPGLESIRKLEPDYFIATGDTVYFDHPAKKGDRWTGTAWSGSAKTETEMRRKYHEQFRQPRFVDLFAQTATYWEVDDHDYRYNDCDNTGDKAPSPALGAKNYREQIPMVDPKDPKALTYGTFRISRDLQIWIVEGRLYRSPNRMKDGPDKTIWGAKQLQWLKDTLLESDATFKILVSPTPLVGPDGLGKVDSHANIGGFKHEGEAFFQWLGDNDFLDKNFYILCGDRHWQYHAIHPSGFQEFSCGALVDANSRFGVKAGIPKSSDPEGTIQQPFCKLEGTPTAGFLIVTIKPGEDEAKAIFSYYDEQGAPTYEHTEHAQIR